MVWVLLSLTLARAQSLVEVADFAVPQPVTGLVERKGPPGCSVHFEFEDPETGWSRFLYGLSLPTTLATADPRVFVPPHNESMYRDTWCANIGESEALSWGISEVWSRYPVAWRIIGGDGVVLTSFAGPYALDAVPLATRLDAMDDYNRGKADPACQALQGQECWTAFELWVYLEDWAGSHCIVDGDAATLESRP